MTPAPPPDPTPDPTPAPNPSEPPSPALAARDAAASDDRRHAGPQGEGPIVVLTCAVLELEVEHYRDRADRPLVVEVLPQGLHNEPDELRRRLQEAIDRAEADHAPAAIVLGYGLCSRGTEGVRAATCPLVIPRAHDCITVLLGSKERYARYVAENPGTYWYSPGWNKHHTPPGPERYENLYAQYVEKYGEDNAEFLMEAEQHWFSSYDNATYVDLTVGATDEDLAYTRKCAAWLNWNFDHQRGDPGLLIDLLSGRWDAERFLVLEPGRTLKITADDRVIEAADV